MTKWDELLGNYHHERHVLQLVNLPAFSPPARSFLYMKNHKAACTTVMATLIAQMAMLNGEAYDRATISPHKPPQSLLKTGKRGLSCEDVMSAILNPSVFKFTIIRDPIARTVSAWADKIQSGGKHNAALMKFLGRDPSDELSLGVFIDIIAHDEGARDLDRHWRSQRLEIGFDHIPFDYIGTVEAMTSAMPVVLSTIFGEATAAQINDTRRTLGHKTGSEYWRDLLTSQDIKNLERAFESDFDMYDTVKHTYRVAA